MSNSLSSFLVQGSSQTAVPFEGEAGGSSLSVGAFLTGLTTANPHCSTSFLTPSSQTSDAAFLTSQAGTSETFLSLSESSETAETFLSGTEGDVSNAEEVLLGGNEGESEELAEGPLLYLDPATGLHVLVHHLPHSAQETPGSQLQGDDSSHEQFVVVGALQSEEEQVVVERPLGEQPSRNSCHVSVENMLTSHIVAPVNTPTSELSANQIYDSQLESSLCLNAGVGPSESSGQNHHVSRNENSLLSFHTTGGTVEDQGEQSSLMDCSESPMLTLQVPDESGEVTTSEIRRDLLGIESVPHINLEEIIEKFTGSSNHHQVIDNTSSVTVTTHVGAAPSPASEGNSSANLTNVTVFKDDPLHHDRRIPLESHIHITPESSLQDTYSMKSLTSITSKSSPKSTVTVKLHNFDDISSLEQCKISSKSNLQDSLAVDEESLYDIVMTYRCKLCSEVFIEKSGLLQHYQDVHKPGGVVKIRITTSENNEPSFQSAVSRLSSKKSLFGTHMNNIILKGGSDRKEEPKELNIVSCEFCSEDFVGLLEYQEHIKKEHPDESEKKARKGTYRHRHSQGLLTKYPPQPGMLIGHRKSRTHCQEDVEDKKLDGGETSKRRVRAPKNLQEQYWLQKQRPKPVFSKEVEKTFKCPIPTCKYRFSSEENLFQHQECHGQPGSGEERVFTCHQCFFKYDKWAMCQLHLWKAHGIDIDLFTCGICHTYKTCTQQKLVIHQKTHSDVRDHICKVCGKGFRQLAQLLNHQVLHITSTKNLPTWAKKGYCNECKRWFGDKKTLRVHISAVHLKLKPHACPHCSYRCSRKFDLKVHQRQHTGERPHKCELCGWQCRDHNALRRHKLIHLHLKPLKCPHAFCAFESRHTAYFKKHVAKKHPKAEAIYKCQICSMETPKLQQYIAHSTNHEKQLVIEAFKKRSGSPNPRNDTEDAVDQQSNLKPEEGINSKIEHHNKVEVSRVQDIGEESFVFDHVGTANNNPNTQVITIKLHSVQHSGVTNSEAVNSIIDKGPAPIFKCSDQFKQEIKIENDAAEETCQGTAVLGVVDSSSEDTAVLHVDGDETLMTLPQVVMSEDGHQYIIGISPDEMSTSQNSIFTIQQAVEQE
ncbi:zinc finger protein 227-like isoform X2 [Homarus americanus]|nr:zinc finger protein 227-like isoform X2 [Homarus americanus]